MDKSLLRWDGAARYDLHELVRQYAGEKLDQANETEHTRQQHLIYFLQLAEQAEGELNGPRQAGWLQRLDDELVNIRAALTWSLQQDAPEAGLRLASALWWFWPIYGHVREGYQWFNRLLPQIDTVAPALQSRVLLGAAGTAWYQGQFDQSSVLAQRCVVLSRMIGDKRATALAGALLAVHAAYRGEIKEAVEWHRRSVALLRETDDSWGLGVALGGQGIAEFNLVRMDDAETSLTEALALFRELGDAWGVMYAGSYLGLTLVQKGAYQQAEQVLKEGLGFIRVLGIRVSIPESLDGLAATAVVHGQNERAITLSSAADALREMVGFFISPAVRSIRADYVARARIQLDEATFAAAWATGRAMTLEQAIAYAMEGSAVEANQLARARTTLNNRG